MTSELVRRAQTGDKDALVLLIDRYRPLARSVAARRCGRHLEFADALSICIQAFIATLAQFNSAKLELSVYWRAKANHALSDYYRAASPLSRANYNLAKIYRQELEEFRARGGNGQLYAEDFARRHGISLKRARNLLLTVHSPAQISQPSGDFGDFMQNGSVDESPTPRDQIEHLGTLAFIKEKITRLSPSERNVVERFFGLNGYDAESLVSISARARFSPQRAHQILSKALFHMRDHVKRMDDPTGS